MESTIPSDLGTPRKGLLQSLNTYLFEISLHKLKKHAEIKRIDKLTDFLGKRNEDLIVCIDCFY